MMTVERGTRKPVEFHDAEARRLIRFAGAAYGLIFGLSFSLLSWGYDALVLASGGAHLAWARLFLGLPLAVAICALFGWLTAAHSSTAIFVVVWMAVGGVLGVIAGHIPFDGGNLAAWIADRRLWGAPIFPFGDSARVRTILLILIEVALGAAVGFTESFAVEWAWQRASAKRRMSGASWASLLVCVPLATLSAVAASALVYQPLRRPQRRVGELISASLSGSADAVASRGLSYRTIEPFSDALSDQFASHFVAFSSDTQTWYSAYVDVAFDDGLVLRCVTSGKNVVYCDDFSQRLSIWVGDLVHAGLTGERRWLEARVRRLAVQDDAVTWLGAHRDQLSETYEARRVGHQGGWILTSIRFDTGFEILCRFHEAAPVMVDQCDEVSGAAP